jgi:hypothetical protein
MVVPIRVQCPLCKCQFDLGEFSPDCAVRCPECLAWGAPVPFAAGAEAEAPNCYAVGDLDVPTENGANKTVGRSSRRQEEEDERSRPRRRRLPDEDEGPVKPKRRMPPQFGMVHLGLWFCSARVVGSMLGILVELMWPMLIPVLGLSEGLIRFVQAFDNIIGVAIALLGATGAVLCCRVPPQSGARPLIFAALAGDTLPWPFASWPRWWRCWLGSTAVLPAISPFCSLPAWPGFAAWAPW